MELISPTSLLFWMTLTFLLVFLILKKFAWRPILRMLDEREQKIDASLKLADQTREEMQLLQAENARAMEEMQMKRKEMLIETEHLRKKLLEKASAEARQTAEKMIEEAKIRISQEKMAAIEALKWESAVLAREMAERILRKELSSQSVKEGWMNQLIEEVSVDKRV
ncbi:MAG: F0F1 ATP synthase subunit B [Bacteroidales bacterium]